MKKANSDQTVKPVVVRRYSDHPVVQKKLEKARAVFEKIDLSFLDNPPRKKTEE